jgi:hypothetical protein
VYSISAKSMSSSSSGNLSFIPHFFTARISNENFYNVIDEHLAPKGIPMFRHRRAPKAPLADVAGGRHGL